MPYGRDVVISGLWFLSSYDLPARRSLMTSVALAPARRSATAPRCVGGWRRQVYPQKPLGVGGRLTIHGFRKKIER
jgi:hypothetical protein